MKVLVTTGGTIVPIDPVRYIANWSRGNFGTKIVKEFLCNKHDVLQIRAKYSAHPFRMTVDENSSLDDVINLTRFIQQYSGQYSQIEYQTCFEYAEILQNSIVQYQPDIILLAAAVSDYITTPATTKIRSSEELTIQLSPFTKIISHVREWCGPNTILVGFKLLVDVTDEELIAAARKSVVDNKCDFVLANEFNKLKAGQHQVIAVSTSDAVVFSEPQTIPKRIVETVQYYADFIDRVR